jgi:hypothetical protein
MLRISAGHGIRPRDYVRPRPALARDAAHGQDTSSNREIGHFCTASITLAPLQRTEPTELTEGGPPQVGSDTPLLGYAICSDQLPCYPHPSSRSASLQSAESQIIWLALARLRRETNRPG